MKSRRSWMLGLFIARQPGVQARRYSRSPWPPSWPFDVLAIGPRTAHGTFGRVPGSAPVLPRRRRRAGISRNFRQHRHERIVNPSLGDEILVQNLLAGIEEGHAAGRQLGGHGRSEIDV